MQSTMHKKILFIVEAMGGGIFTYIVDLANELAGEFDIYIAYAVRPQTPENYRTYFDKRIHLIEVANFGREIRLKRELAAITEIRRIAEKIQPDIIHLHSSKAGVIGRVAFDGKKIPLYYTPHGYSFLNDGTGLAKRKIYWGLEKWFAKKKCTTICCSRGEYEEALKLSTNAIQIDNAVNTEFIQGILRRIPPTNQSLKVYTSGRICYQKNPTLFNEVAERMPDTKFLWIGDGPLKNTLTNKNIEITGWISRENALMRSADADVFILTSRYEGLPMALLEAMCMKKICVVSNVIGSRDVIHNGDNGYVCGEAADFVKAINEKKKEYTEKAYLDVTEKYDIKVQAQKYAAVYRERLERR